MTHREETELVKNALRKAGIPFTRVTHGSGTARSWLYIYLGEGWSRCRKEALEVAQDVTGRRGDYDGNINIFN